MAPGDLYEAEECTDVYYLDTGMYGTPEFGSVYIVDAERPAVVDTGIGTNVEYLFDALDELGIGEDDLEVVATTHVHLDHAGGAGFLAERYPNADVYVHEIGAPHLVDPEKLIEGTKRAVGDMWRYYVDPKPVPAERIVEFAGGDEIDLGDRTLAVHHVPGHAPHQVVFEDDADDAVYCADAAGIWQPGPEFVTVTTPPPNFDLEQNLADLDLLRDLDPSVLLFSHYGPNYAPDEVLDDYEETLTEWVADVEEQWRQLGDREAVVEHFVERTDLDRYWAEPKAYGDTRMNTEGVLLYLRRREE